VRLLIGVAVVWSATICVDHHFSLHPNVSEDGHRRATALDFNEARIILHSIAAVTDDSSVVHDDAGVSVRLVRVGCNDDVSWHSVAHGNFPEAAVMQQTGVKD